MPAYKHVTALKSVINKIRYLNIAAGSEIVIFERYYPIGPF